MFIEFALIGNYSSVFLFHRGNGHHQMTFWPCGSRAWSDSEAKKRRASGLPDAVYYLPGLKWKHVWGPNSVVLDYPDENIQIEAVRYRLE